MQWRYFSWLILLAAVFISYANVFQNDFVYDDEFLIQKNQNIRTWSGVGQSFLMSSTGGSGAIDSFYRPLQGVLYTVVYQTLGLHTDGFHLLNILLHALCALLIFSLAMKLEFSPIAALIAALLWAVHPIHTEAVTYASATADPLYTAFLLAGLLVAAPEFSLGKVFLASLFYIGGLLSKETAIVFPAVMTACIFLTSSRRWSWRSYLVTWPLWVIAIVYLILRKTVLDFDHSFIFYKTANVYSENFLYRVFTFFATLPSYLSLIFWPTDLHMDRQFSVYTSLMFVPVMLGVAWLALGSVMVWRERDQDLPIWSFAFLWFLAAHVPHMGVLLPVNSIFLEHWMYLPSIGFFIAGSQTIVHKIKNEKWMLVPAVGLSIALIIATLRQNEIWSTPITLYTHILKLNPQVARVHNNLAMAYTDVHEDRLAIEHYSKAIEISDVYPQTHHNLALALLRLGQVEDAVKHLNRALELDADFYHSSLVLAQLYHQNGNEEKAQEYSKRWATSLQKFKH